MVTNKSYYEKAIELLKKNGIDEHYINELIKQVNEDDIKKANKLKYKIIKPLLEEKGLLDKVERKARKQQSTDITLEAYFGKKIASLLIRKKELEEEIYLQSNIDISSIIDKIKENKELTSQEMKLFTENYKKKNSINKKLENELKSINKRLKDNGITIEYK